MKSYHVYKHPTLGLEAVKLGFSWPAFFFGFFWMLAKKLWGVAGFCFVIYIVCALIERVADTSSDSGSKLILYLLLFAAYMALWLIPAFKGNQWRESNLMKSGFSATGSVKAETPDAAIAQVHSAASQETR